MTCYPFYYLGSAPKRFIVRAREVGGSGTDEHRADTDQHGQPIEGSVVRAGP